MGRRKRIIGLTVLLVAGGIVAGLTLAEIGLRAYALANRSFAARLRQYDLLAVQIEPMGPYGYRQRPDAKFHYENGTVATSNALGYRGPVVAVPKPAGIIRVVLVGGSTTHGWGVNDSQTIDTYMRQDLARRFPGRHIQVVNLAFDGYDSYQDFERIRTQGLELQPDVIILNAGINDVRNARFADLRDHDPRTLLWAATVSQLRAEMAQGGPRLSTQLKHFSYVARFASMVRDVIRQRSAADRRDSPSVVPHWGALDYYERNVLRIAALARDSGIALLLSNPPSAIPSNFPPDAVSPRGYWIEDAQVTQQVRDSLDARTRSIAADLRARGQRVTYVDHHLSPTMFLDDAHLTPEGNRAEAVDFSNAVANILDIGRSVATSVPRRSMH